jgi:hypothetical protein
MLFAAEIALPALVLIAGLAALVLFAALPAGWGGGLLLTRCIAIIAYGVVSRSHRGA